MNLPAAHKIGSSPQMPAPLQITSPPQSLELEYHLAGKCAAIEQDPLIANLLSSGKPLAWIGSGLSRIAAELGYRLSHDHLNSPATCFTPLEYCSVSVKCYLPILITFGGKNSDSLSVAKHIIHQEIKEIILVTGSKETSCEKMLREAGIKVGLVLAPEHPKENRFLAFIHLFISCAAVHCLNLTVKGHEHFKKNMQESFLEAKNVSKTLIPWFTSLEGWRDKRWVVLGGGVSFASAHAWQVMLSESGLCDVVIADMKDYTHARYMSALQRTDMAYLILADKQNGNIANTIDKRFSELFPSFLINMNDDPALAFWSHLGIAAITISELCHLEGFDTLSPPKPSFFKNWSNWGKIIEKKSTLE